MITVLSSLMVMMVMTRWLLFNIFVTLHNTGVKISDTTRVDRHASPSALAPDTGVTSGHCLHTSRPIRARHHRSSTNQRRGSRFAMLVRQVRVMPPLLLMIEMMMERVNRDMRILRQTINIFESTKSLKN